MASGNRLDGPLIHAQFVALGFSRSSPQTLGTPLGRRLMQWLSAVSFAQSRAGMRDARTIVFSGGLGHLMNSIRPEIGEETRDVELLKRILQAGCTASSKRGRTTYHGAWIWRLDADGTLAINLGEGLFARIES